MHQFRAALDRWRAGDAAGAFRAVAAMPDFPGDPRAARRWARLGDAEMTRFELARRSRVIECSWGRFRLASSARAWTGPPMPVLGAREVRDFLRAFLAWADRGGR